MTVTYRDAVPSDAKRLVDVFSRGFCDTFGHLYDPQDLRAFLHEHSTEHWREQLESRHFAVRIAETGGDMCGFIKFGTLKLPVESADRPIELRQLYVLSEWQGSGIAAELMDWCIAEARRRGAGALYLSVFTDNHRARRFYRRYGFEDVAPYKFMVGEQADEDMIMGLQL